MKTHEPSEATRSYLAAAKAQEPDPRLRLDKKQIGRLTGVLRAMEACEVFVKDGKLRVESRPWSEFSSNVVITVELEAPEPR
jgi:hypothetical protein